MTCQERDLLLGAGAIMDFPSPHPFQTDADEAKTAKRVSRGNLTCNKGLLRSFKDML